MRHSVFDIVILGGGPAGCMAAIAAANENSGLKIAVLEKSEEPLHRVGEALLTGTVMSMADVGIIDDIMKEGYHKKIGAAYLWGEERDKPWYVNYPVSDDPYPEQLRHDDGRYALHVPRHKFDAVLRRCAIERGVEFIYDKPADIVVSERAKRVVSIRLESGKVLFSSYWIDATGQEAVLARRVTKRSPVGTAHVARYGYFSDLNWGKATDFGFDISRTNILSSNKGWIWAIHLGEAGDNLTSVGFVSTPNEMKGVTFSNALEAFPELDIFGYGDGVEPRDCYGQCLAHNEIYRHPDYSYRCEELHGPNWAIVGDAALFLDPILSQGVTLAMHYGVLRGRAAVSAIGGDVCPQQSATQHYWKEGEVLRRVIGQWYGNNRSVEDWKLNALDIGKEFFGVDLNADDAFRYVTNLENIINEYHPFDENVRKNIDQRLGGVIR